MKLNQQQTITFLRYSLSLVFVWFGLLKLFNVSPVVDIIAEAYPFMVHINILYVLLALFEVMIGIGFLIKKYVVLVSWLAVAHLLIATTGVLFTHQAFTTTFPMLSVVGEFVVKNIVLAASALVIIGSKES
jgi:uncharacterized membrane protein YkgB